MKIAIASGKGGTGKTTVAVNLTCALDALGLSVIYADCDVEEPNGHLFLNPQIEKTSKVAIPVPDVDHDKCTLCGECGKICQYSAIVVLPEKTLVFRDMCHGCGGCSLVCPVDAITEIPNYIGIVESGKSNNIGFIHGKLDIGRAFSPPIIRDIKKNLWDADVIIMDSPPGTSCPVITSINDADYVLLVTEPTPFGVNDLKLAVGMVIEVGVPFSIIVNRSDIGDDEVYSYCADENLNIIMEIPNDRKIAQICSRGGIIVDEIPEYMDRFVDLFHAIKTRIVP